MKKEGGSGFDSRVIHKKCVNEKKIIPAKAAKFWKTIFMQKCGYRVIVLFLIGGVLRQEKQSCDTSIKQLPKGYEGSNPFHPHKAHLG